MTAWSRAAGPIEAPAVVIATGAWSGVVGRLAGVDIPVTPAAAPQVHDRAVSGFDAIPAATPFIIDPHPGFSLRREGAGLLLGIGRRDEPGAFSTELDWSLSRAAGGARRPPRARAGRRRS